MASNSRTVNCIYENENNARDELHQDWRGRLDSYANELRTWTFTSARLQVYPILFPMLLNFRIHSDEQVAQLTASVWAFGITNPVLIDEEYNFIAGYERVLAAIILKRTKVPAIVVAGSDDRKCRALVIVYNKLTLNADCDVDALKVELENLAGDFDKLLGFSQEELVDLLAL